MQGAALCLHQVWNKSPNVWTNLYPYSLNASLFTILLDKLFKIE